jgi:hypothetical protein
MTHRNFRPKSLFPLLLMLIFLVLGVWSVGAQDGDTLPLPVSPSQSGGDAAANLDLLGDTLLGRLTNPVSSSTDDQLALPGSQMSPRLFAEIQQITPPALAGGQYFGIDLALDGNLMVAGAPLRNMSAGDAFIYQRSSGGAWVSPVTLTASDAAANALFGYAVAIYGTTVFVTAPGADAKGAVYVFQQDSGGTWVQKQKLQPSLDTGDNFGADIQIDPAGNQLIVAVLGRSSGIIYRLNSGGQWQYETELVAADTVESATIDGNLALVGGYTASTAPGTVYVYEKSAGAWTPTTTFVPSDGFNGDSFGGRIRYHGGQAFVIGSLFGSTGAVYVFKEVGGLWTQQQKLVASDAATDDRFGVAIEPDGNTLAVGSPYDEAGQGSVYIFKWNGTAWVQDDKIPAIGGTFGIGAALKGSTLLVGAPTIDTNTGKIFSYTDPDLVPTATPSPTETPVPPTATPTHEPATELLINGGFEANAAGWTVKNATSDKVKCNKTGKIFSYEGNCAWRFKGGIGENAKIEQTINAGVNPGDILTLSGFVNASGVVDSKVKVVVKYLDTSLAKNKITVNISPTGGVYVPLSSFQPLLTANVTAPIQKIKVSAKNQGTSGKVYYDALSLIAQ